MPGEYYPAAQIEFAEAVDEYMVEQRKDVAVYKGKTDFAEIARRGYHLRLGQRIRLESDYYFPEAGYRVSRITKITRKLLRPTEMDIEVGDVVGKGYRQQVSDSIAEIRNYTRTAAADSPGIIRSWEDTPPSDTTVYSSRKSDREFLSKTKEDTAEKLLRLKGGAEFGEFLPGMEIGTGGKIDAEGNAEVQSLKARSFIKTPVLEYNKIQVTGGEFWNTEGGTIKSVRSDGENAYILELDVEEGEHVELAVDDICRGHFNHSGGFITSYFRVTHVDDAAGTIRIVLGAETAVPGGQNHAPHEFMNIARYGNFTVAARQRSQYLSSVEGYIVLLDGVDDYRIEARHYRGVLGRIPTNLLPEGLPMAMSEVSAYFDSVVAKRFFQIDDTGQVVKTIRDRGPWQKNPETPYLCSETMQDEVYHLSCKWRCLVEGTTDAPAYNSTDWLWLAGDTTLRLDIESTAGNFFLRGQLSTTLLVSVRRGVNDITDSILPSDFKWTRQSGDVLADTIWNSAHSSASVELALTDEDVVGESNLFTCTVYVADGRETLEMSYQI
jgi:hypothetical protein